MTPLRQIQPSGWAWWSHTLRPIATPATPVIVIIVIVLSHMFTRVELSLILGR